MKCTNFMIPSTLSKGFRMDESLKQDMIKDLHDAIGYVVLPDHAKQAKEWQEIGNMKYEPIRKSLNKLVESGAWKKARRGNKTFYWKVLEEE